MTEQQQIHILMIDDSDIDVMAFQRGMRAHGLDYPLTVATNGRDALRLLRRDQDLEAALPLPSAPVVFLDLNMPVMNGREFLDEYSRDETIPRSPIFVLTTSEFYEDELEGFEHLVAGFCAKSNLRDACLVISDLPES